LSKAGFVTRDAREVERKSWSAQSTSRKTILQALIYFRLWYKKAAFGRLFLSAFLALDCLTDCC
jgi:hypothetical protein